MRPLASRLLEQPIVYRLWMAPFAEQKLRPVRSHIELDCSLRVLDVGCGPGTNAPMFAGVEYVGIDINPSYVESAKRRHRGTFIVADVTTYRVNDAERFDVILLNSLLHHLDDASTSRLLRHLAGLLTDRGRVHVLELLMPEHRSIARFLARHDRGRFPRSLQAWSALLGGEFEPLVIEPYPVGVAGVTLWNMLYFLGRAR